MRPFDCLRFSAFRLKEHNWPPAVRRQTILTPPRGDNENPLPYVALVGLAIGFVLPTFAQQKDTSDQELHQMADSLARKLDEAWNNNDAAAAAALYTEDGVHASYYQTSRGRHAIEKSYAHDFQRWHPNNHIITVYRVTVAGNGVRAAGKSTESHVEAISAMFVGATRATLRWI